MTKTVAELAHQQQTPAASLIASARELLAGYAPFRGRMADLQFEAQANALVVRGIVPTFYLRQLLQAALRRLPAPVRVVNRVEVICPQGISGCSAETRARCALEFKILGKVPSCFPTCPGTPGSDGDEQ